jgi:predicted HD phosphohydrolase
VEFLARSLYRSRQFFRSVGASISDEERREVSARLSGEEQRLFFAMTARDQRHSLDVLHVLLRQGQSDPELLSAALLHDGGKGRVRIWHRVVYVLLRAASKRLFDRVASSESASWRGSLAAIADHARRGASLAKAAGASEGTVQLIRRHEETEGDLDPRVAILRAADESC